MLFRHFPVAWACSGGDRRRGCGQTAPLATGASVTTPALGPVIPRYPAPGDGPLLAGFGRCRLFEGERHTLQTLKPGGFNQWLPTKKPVGRTQDRSRQGDRLGKRDRRHHPAYRHLFAHLPREGEQWKTTHSFGFKNLLTLAKLADQAHTLIAERNAEAAPGAGDNEAG